MARTFKFWRLIAIEYVVKNDTKHYHLQNGLPAALQLGAVAVHMLHALTYRPADRRAETELFHASAAYELVDPPEEDNLTREEVRDLIAEGDMEPLLAQRGAYFVSDVVSSRGVWHLPYARCMTKADLCKLFLVPAWAELEIRFLLKPDDRPNKKTGQNVRTPLARPRTRAVVAEPEDEPDETLAEATHNVEFRRPVYMAGEDIRARGQDADPASVDPADNLTNIWKQFIRDVLELCPSAKGGESYSALSAEERDAVTEETYQSYELPMRKAQIKVAQGDTWNKIFDRAFPGRGQKVPAKLQHYRGGTYWGKWELLKSRVTADGETALRAALRSKFDTLLWFPYGESDRMWSTKAFTGQYVRLPADSTGAAPQIAVNQKKRAQLGDFSLK